MWHRAAVLEELSALRDHCIDTLTYQLYGEAPAIQPSKKLCELAEKERWNWVRDEPLARYGINPYHVVSGYFENTTQKVQKAMQLAKNDSSIPLSAQLFCDLAEVEWVKSQWGPIYEKQRRIWMEGREAKLGERESKQLLMGSLLTTNMGFGSPPHQFGTSTCAAYVEIASWVANRNQRRSWEPPRWLAAFALSWPLLLGANIAFRLVKTTAEVRKAMVAASATK